MYSNHVVFENRNKVIYVVVLRATYYVLVAALLLCKKFCGGLENIGFESNYYDPCVANRIKVDKQHTVILHVDDVIYSNVNPKVNDKFKEWMNLNYGKHGEVKSNRGKVHEYLGISFNFIKNER